MEAAKTINVIELEREQHRLEGMACALRSIAEKQSFDAENEGWMLIFFGEEIQRAADTIEAYVNEVFQKQRMEREEKN